VKRANDLATKTNFSIAGRFWQRAGLTILLTAMCVTAADAQTKAKCPINRELTLDQVVGFVDQKLPDERTVELIESCQVGFGMNTAAIERLISAGTSETVLNVLNRVTASRLTLEEARSEVTELERHTEQGDSAVKAQRDAALRDFDAAYQQRRDQASHIEPKGEFESTRDYNARVLQSQNSLAAMDRKHDADRAQLAAQYAGQAAHKDKPFRDRVQYLQALTYPDLRPATFEHYNADTNQLTAQVGTDEYLFEQVPPKTAETLFKNWPKVKASQPIADDDLHKRTLVLDSASIAVTGSSRKALDGMAKQRKDAVLNAQLAHAQVLMDHHNYDGALNEYNSVLSQDPDNQAAKDGIAAVQAMRKHQADALVEQQTAGEWVDTRTRLMWTLTDNGNDINWKGANEYCETLRTGGFSDWRLPAVRELWALYNPAVTRMTAKRGTHLKLFDTTTHTVIESSNGASVDYHISGEIILTATWLWSLSQNNADRNQYAIVKFRTGKWEFSAQNEKTFLRALCVRSSSSGTPTVSETSLHSAAAPPASASNSATGQIGGKIGNWRVWPPTVTINGSVMVSYVASGAGAAGFVRAELWRSPDVNGKPGHWAGVKTQPLSGVGPKRVVFTDIPPVAGKYWYGTHLIEGDGAETTELAPAQVTVVARP
jgi:hypothetical protein